MNILVLLVVILMGTQADARDFWVSKSGNNGNACTNSATELTTTAKLTVAAGIACLTQAGDTLHIGDGTYAEHLNLSDVPVSGTSSAWITITAVNQWGAILRPTTGGVAGADATRQYIEVKNFDIDGSGHSNDDYVTGIVYISGASGTASNIKFTGNKIHHSTGNGIFITHASNITFANNKIYTNGTSGNYPGQTPPFYLANGLYGESGDNIIFDGNEVYNNICIGLRWFNTDPPPAPRAHGNIVRNNYLHDNGPGYADFGGPECHNSGNGAISLGDYGNVAYNNIVYHNEIGLQTWNLDAGANIRFYNNTVYGNGTGLDVERGGNNRTEARNNIFYGNDDDVNVTYTVIASTNLCTTLDTAVCTATGNPNFVNAGSGDFSLQSNSPAINQGVDLATAIGCQNNSTCTDYAGTKRPQSGFWDIGAYEYTTGAPPPTPQLVLALPLDTGVGGTALDTSGLGNHGSFGVGVSWDNSGKYGKALAFDGTSSIVIPNANSLNPLAVTVEAWVYPTSTASTYRAVAVKNYSYYLYASSDTGSCGTANVAVAGYNTGADHFACDPISALPINTWSHIAGVYDGIDFAYYRNGTLVSSINSPLGLIASNGALEIGASQYGENFIGKIDEVRIYNYARTQAEIQTDMNTPLTPAAPGAIIKISPATSLKLSATNGALKVGQ